jgi:hypothetical protein
VIAGVAKSGAVVLTGAESKIDASLKTEGAVKIVESSTALIKQVSKERRVEGLMKTQYVDGVTASLAIREFSSWNVPHQRNSACIRKTLR